MKCGNCGHEGHNKRTCPNLNGRVSLSKGRSEKVQRYNEAKEIVEMLSNMDLFNWMNSSNPVVAEMVRRLAEIRSELEDSSLREKLDMMIKRENLEQFDVGVKIVEGESV